MQNRVRDGFGSAAGGWHFSGGYGQAARKGQPAAAPITVQHPPQSCDSQKQTASKLIKQEQQLPPTSTSSGSDSRPSPGRC